MNMKILTDLAAKSVRQWQETVSAKIKTETATFKTPSLKNKTGCQDRDDTKTVGYLINLQDQWVDTLKTLVLNTSVAFIAQAVISALFTCQLI